MKDPMVCPRCDVPLEFGVYVCPLGGRVELFIDGIGEELRSGRDDAPS